MYIHTSVDLPIPPGPHSTNLLAVASPLSNQSRMLFSSLDRRWNPLGTLILNTHIVSILSMSPRAVGAWRALIWGWRLSSKSSFFLAPPLEASHKAHCLNNSKNEEGMHESNTALAREARPTRHILAWLFKEPCKLYNAQCRLWSLDSCSSLLGCPIAVGCLCSWSLWS